MTVRFEEVGPAKLTWETHLPSLLYTCLYREIKRRHALGSRGIEFCFDQETQSGEIFSGLRKVGRFKVLDGPMMTMTITPKMPARSDSYCSICGYALAGEPSFSGAHNRCATEAAKEG